MVIDRPLAGAARAHGPIASMRTQANDECLVIVRQEIVVEDKALEVDDSIE